MSSKSVVFSVTRERAYLRAISKTNDFLRAYKMVTKMSANICQKNKKKFASIPIIGMTKKKFSTLYADNFFGSVETALNKHSIRPTRLFFRSHAKGGYHAIMLLSHCISRKRSFYRVTVTRERVFIVLQTTTKKRTSVDIPRNNR